MTMLEDLREVVRGASGNPTVSDETLENVNLLSALRFIRTHAEQIERDARELKNLRQYVKSNVPCTCSWSGHIGQKADGSYYGDSKITYKCARCQSLEAAMSKGLRTG